MNNTLPHSHHTSLEFGASSLSDSLQSAALSGLENSSKTLPSALFYDAVGARLFEEICKLPEYYPTRTETAILRQYAPALASRIGADAVLIDYGSGSGEKAQFLLDQLPTLTAYVPLDVSREQLMQLAAERSAQHPLLQVLPICADYTEPFDFPYLPYQARYIAFFPGSTVGNFHPPDAADFLAQIRQTVMPDGKLILGVDRRKNPDILHAAYNDRLGLTAAFNLNILRHLNREMNATFNISHFRHLAFFNEEISRIEMHLESLVTHQVMINDQLIHFDAGETIRTEYSYKYNEESLNTLLEASGFQIDQLFTDRREWFWIALLNPIPD
ncbi:L-histidine N(alpha)-methyltransferase [Nitrosomonas sp. JL21]|uniref:L-histidine N(alpha)-methyltransferase n=1 Tax=Nitrosomonas sp. JL21 TaxID=153949 RepID=UPI00136E6D38|nr:L-histidine N(alpha)-methyltransferase [Nitrosomonas sp. JL21]MBL8497702.1 L-histidine N(alpha)-methyltransferase [Nitrosomonas sp.]MCC7091849.1 L-histidine N(alpha)-methyltransferase [Nitrosomonas sp.]MXS78354.1 L-histidine N(alpha)-methyltransferase [Nitrosomonas sp. JL21]